MKSISTLTISNLQEVINRNIDIISEAEQAHLGTAKLLVAGCGSVGGSIVEPLVRIGMMHFILADPEEYDLTNLNRQACTLADVGLKKVDVVAQRARSINPRLDLKTYDKGLTEDNIYDSFEGINIVFDGIDVSATPWVKYLMHKIACERKIPILAGFDFGGKAVIYVFDYRRYSVPFYGRATEQAHKNGDLVASLKWLGYSKYPSDFLPVIADRLISKEPWPQVSYCVMAMGALGVRTIIDVLMARKVPHTVTFDVNMASRSIIARLKEYVSFPIHLAKAFKVSRDSKLIRAEASLKQYRDPLSQYLRNTPDIECVLKNMIRAPSPHNCQPWRFEIKGPTTIKISWNKNKLLDYIDPDGYAIMYSLGCAIEAAASIADIEFIPSDRTDFFASDYYAGTIHIHSIRLENYATNRDLNIKRSTNRFCFLNIQIPENVKTRCISSIADDSSNIRFIDFAPQLLKQTANNESNRLFAEDEYFNELMSYMRLSKLQSNQNPTGFTADSLGISWFESKLLNIFKSSRFLNHAAKQMGLRKVMAWSSTKVLNNNYSYMLFSTSDWTDVGRLEVGRLIMRGWLILTENDIACQPVDFPISSDEGRAKIKDIFAITSEQRPVLLMRIGKATRTHKELSRRMSLENFVQLNVVNFEGK